MNFKILFQTIITLLITSLSIAQGGIINGNVTDKGNGLSIPGVKIMIEGQNKGAFSDLDGKYTIKDLPAGTYSLSFKYDTYNTKIITDILVKANEITNVSVALESIIQELGPITVSVTVSKESTTNLLQLQRNSAGLVDGISSESIKKSPDRAASDVMKRVSGASVQDNKFVIIRGLNDRYNTAMINGLPLPSTEADRKAFSFDIFPSAMLDNMLIFKTASPDLPGDFAGGVIQINTKDIPEKDFLSVSVGTGLNSQSTFKKYTTYSGSKQDWIGFGTNDRSILSSLPNTEQFKESLKDPATRFESSKVFGNDWGLEDKNVSPMNQNYQIAFAKNKKIKKNELGFVGGLNYNYNRRYLAIERQDFNNDSSRIFSYNDDNYRETILWGAMLNFAYKIGDNNKLTFKNMYSNNSEDVVINRIGENIEADQIIKATAIQYTTNKILTSQLTGDHLFKKNKIKIKWGLNYSNTQTSVPNLRRMLYYKNRTTQGTNSDSVYTAYVPQGVPSPDFAGRFFSDLSENLYASMFEISLPYEIFKEKSTLKMGYAGSIKNREFEARVFGYAINSPSQFNYDLLFLPQNEIFAAENITSQGFKLGETTNPSDSYSANSQLHAGYIMTDQKLGAKFRAVYGLRVEDFNQELITKSFGGQDLKINNKTLSYLPSLNLTYIATKKMNLRFAASKTAARPDFRELAPFSFYDFNISSAVVGNDTLKTTDITNLDLRFEFFPGSGQIISTSLFYKDFNNAIENTVFFGGSGSRTYTYQNITNALNYGIEVEFRTNLNLIDSVFNTKIFGDFAFFSNLTFVKSEVDLSNVATAVTEEEKFRPMQGQSPFIINTGLIYTNDKKGLGLSILYNRVGRRIAFVGTNGYQDIYENPRSILDFQISKRLFENGEIKLNISDIFNQNAAFYQDFNRSKKYEIGEDKLITGIKYGTNFSLSFSYKF